MAREKPAALQIETFADHHVITQPNPLRKVLRRVAEKDLDDPVARAEKALADLSGEFTNWMTIESDRLAAAHAAILKDGFTSVTREELFRAAHDIKGDAATFGFPSAGAAADAATDPNASRDTANNARKRRLCMAVPFSSFCRSVSQIQGPAAA